MEGIGKLNLSNISAILTHHSGEEVWESEKPPNSARKSVPKGLVESRKSLFERPAEVAPPPIPKVETKGKRKDTINNTNNLTQQNSASSSSTTTTNESNFIEPQKLPVVVEEVKQQEESIEEIKTKEEEVLKKKEEEDVTINTNKEEEKEIDTKTEEVLSVSSPSSSSTTTDIVFDLPQKAIELIFSFLPPSDLLNASLVCKYWNLVTQSNHVWEKKLGEEGLEIVFNDKLIEKYETPKRIFWCLPRIRFDGLYMARDDSNYRILRFYEDDSIALSVVTSGFDLNKIQNWFVKDSHEFAIPSGHYLIKRNELKFTIRSQSGKIDYFGSSSFDSLVLNVHSHINNSKKENILFQFVQFA